jgi:hypothetical protein
METAEDPNRSRALPEYSGLDGRGFKSLRAVTIFF